jgi:hypothetical protein
MIRLSESRSASISLASVASAGPNSALPSLFLAARFASSTPSVEPA